MKKFIKDFLIALGTIILLFIILIVAGTLYKVVMFYPIQ